MSESKLTQYEQGYVDFVCFLIDNHEKEVITEEHLHLRLDQFIQSRYHKNSEASKMPEEKEYLDSEENLVPMPKLNKRLMFEIIHSEEKEVLEAAKLIKKYCKSREACYHECVFYDKPERDCHLIPANSNGPWNWQLKEE